MTDQALWALGRGTGITALAFLTISLGLGIATRSGRRLAALPRFAVADVHRFAALAGTLLVAMHLALLFLDPYAQLRLVDLLVPFREQKVRMEVGKFYLVHIHIDEETGRIVASTRLNRYLDQTPAPSTLALSYSSSGMEVSAAW